MILIRHIIYLFISSVALLADTASIIGGSGGMIDVQPHQNIEMTKQNISIDVQANIVEFHISYTFKNNSEAIQNVSMGFPQKKEGFDSLLFDFQAYDGEDALLVKLHKTPVKQAYDWYLYDVSFAPNETKEFHNSYWIYPTHYAGLYSISYILETGSSWKKNIGEVKIEVKLDPAFHFSPAQFAAHELEIVPQGYTIDASSQKLSWNFRDINPTQYDNLSIIYLRKGRPFMAYSDTASSTLTLDDLYGEYYGPENILDGDLTTAWGTAKGPIGEWVRVDFVQPLPTLSKIGIFPGLAPDERFVNADQLKKATLLFSDGSSQRIEFRQIPKMQFFEVAKNDISWVQLKIDEVYEGLLNIQNLKATAYISQMEFFE